VPALYAKAAGTRQVARKKHPQSVEKAPHGTMGGLFASK
jgi:hypothetical protein